MRFLVVDDDVTICEGTARRLRGIGHEAIASVACAFSAEEALAELERGGADVLFTDIRMGGKDGLWLIEQARRMLPDLLCVVVSAYGDFSYAQQAIRLGVQDYLVKPSGMEEMRTLTLRIIVRHQTEQQQRQGQLDAALTGLAGGKAGTLEAAFAESGASLPGRPMQVAAWRGTLRWPEMSGMWHYQPQEGSYMLCCAADEGDLLEPLAACCRALGVSVGVSETGDSLSEMLRQAREAACLGWFWPEARAIRWQPVPQLSAEAKALQSHVRALETQKVRQMLSALAGSGHEDAAPELSAVIPILYAALIRFCGDKGIDAQVFGLPEGPYGWRRVVEDFAEAMERVRVALLSQSRIDPVAFAKRYMREHLCEPLDMAEVAALLHMSYAHFSRVFHREAGESFQAHLLRLRMEAAGRMLWEGESVARIAERLCYQNANNFTRSFTKHYGKPPSAWREAQKGERCGPEQL